MGLSLPEALENIQEKKNVKKSWKMSVPELAEEWIDLFLLLFCE